jgi:hypothetical protein
MRKRAQETERKRAQETERRILNEKKGTRQIEGCN